MYGWIGKGVGMIFKPWKTLTRKAIENKLRAYVQNKPKFVHFLSLLPTVHMGGDIINIMVQTEKYLIYNEASKMYYDLATHADSVDTLTTATIGVSSLRIIEEVLK